MRGRRSLLSAPRIAGDALAKLLYFRNDEKGLWDLADVLPAAAQLLSNALQSRGDEVGLRKLARQNNKHAAYALAHLMWRRHDYDGLQELASGGNVHAARYLSSPLKPR
jgi:hypothetical protein